MDTMTRTIVLLLTLLLLAPATLAAEEGNATDRPAWTELMPPKTMFVVRVDPERFDGWWEPFDAALKRVGSDDAVFPARDRMSALAGALISRNFDDVFQGRHPVLKAIDFEHLDHGRPLLMALSSYGHAPFLEAVRAGVLPPEDERTREAGRAMALRLLLPSEAPERLAGEIDGLCDAKTGRLDCENLLRTKAVDEGTSGYLAVDLMSGRGDAQTVAETLGWDAPDPMFDASYFDADRATPAARQFIERASGLSAYARPRQLADFGALAVGARTFYSNRERVATHEMRVDQVRDDPTMDDDARRRRIRRQSRRREFNERRMYRALAEAMTFRRLLAPEAAEAEDAAVFVDATGSSDVPAPEKGVTVEGVQSFTERGRAVARAGRLEAALPILQMRRPILEMAWNFNFAAAFEAVRVPRWIRKADGRGADKLEHFSDMLRDTEGFGMIMVLAGQPLAWLKGSLATMDEAKLSLKLKDLAGVVAGRLWLDGQPTFERRVPVKVMGGLVLAADESSKAPGQLRAGLEMLGMALQMPVSFETGATDKPEGRETMQVTFDRSDHSDRFVEPSRGSTLDAAPLGLRVDFDRLLARVEPMARGRRLPFDDDWVNIGRFLKGLSLRMAESEAGRTVQLRLGPGAGSATADAPELAPAPDYADPVDPEPIPECADTAAFAAHDFVREQLAAGKTWYGRPRGARREADDEAAAAAARKKREKEADKRLAEVKEAHAALVDTLQAAAKACREVPEPWRGYAGRTLAGWTEWQPTAQTVPLPELYGSW